jgi:hypothetical protein
MNGTPVPPLPRFRGLIRSHPLFACREPNVLGLYLTALAHFSVVRAVACWPRPAMPHDANKNILLLLDRE